MHEMWMKPQPLPRLASILAALSLLLFTVLTLFARGDSTLALDRSITRRVQGWDWPGLTAAYDLTNWAMHGLVASVIIIGLIMFAGWRRWWPEVAVLLLLFPLRALNGLLKEMVGSPRPSPDQVRVDGTFDGYGYPSGHTTAAVLIAGVLIWMVWRRSTDPRWQWVSWASGCALVLLTALGRISVGAHWPSDTIGAILWAGPALVLVIWIAETVVKGRRGR